MCEGLCKIVGSGKVFPFSFKKVLKIGNKMPYKGNYILVKGSYKVYNIPVGGLCKPYKGNWMLYQFGRKWIKSMVKN